jgi:DNA-binding transcriptional LysR family regulator
LMQLLSKEVDLAIMYALPDEATSDISGAFEAVHLGEDLLIPVCAPSLQDAASRDVIPIIAYPADVFLGHVFTRMVSPRLPQGTTTLPIAETALTLAMLQLAVSAIGIAWLPMALVEKSIAVGELIRVDATLPAQVLSIKMVRLRSSQTEQNEMMWHALAQYLQLPPDFA